MTAQPIAPEPATPDPEPAPELHSPAPIRSRLLPLCAAVAVAAFGVGGLVGYAVHPQPAVPAACTEALDKGEAVMELERQGLQAASEGFGAVSTGDTATIDAMNERVRALTPQLTVGVAGYQGAAAQCRAGQ
jgi:hypothetical protein